MNNYARYAEKVKSVLPKNHSIQFAFRPSRRMDAGPACTVVVYLCNLPVIMWLRRVFIDTGAEKREKKKTFRVVHVGPGRRRDDGYIIRYDNII